MDADGIAEVKKNTEKPVARPSANAEILLELQKSLGESWLPRIYQTKVRSLRTRANRLGIPAKENKVEIQHTLLGVELKVGKQRLFCPDLATARYLQVFARIGCVEIAVPYDITKISTLADELESAWQKTWLLVEQATMERSPTFRTRLHSSVIAEMREELNAIGAGEAMPEFNQNTKQNLYRGKN